MHQVSVTNLTRQVVVRGGRAFPPLSTTTAFVGKSGMKEIQACIYLKSRLVEPEGNTPQAVEPIEPIEVVPPVEPVEPPEPTETVKEPTETDDPVESEQEYACPVCDYKTDNKRGLQAHIRQRHPAKYERLRSE